MLWGRELGGWMTGEEGLGRGERERGEGGGRGRGVKERGEGRRVRMGRRDERGKVEW